MQLDRAFMPTYGDTSLGTVVMFAGKVSDIDASRTGLDIKCRSHLELFNIQMPRRLWQAPCTHVFGQPGIGMCGYDRVNGLNALGASTGIGAQSIAATAGSTQTAINYSGANNAYMAQGSIIGLTGANAGQTRTIATMAVGPQVQVKLAFLSPVSVGDTFQLLPGCDHSVFTCTNLFNNVDRFGGTPYTPTPETAV